MRNDLMSEADVERAHKEFQKFFDGSAGLFKKDDATAFIAGFLVATVNERKSHEQDD
jgi:hypothetical protein